MQLNYWITHRSKRKLNFKIPYFLALTAITKRRRRRRRRNRRGLGRWNDNSSSKNGDDHGPRHGDGRRRRPHGRMAPHDPPPLLQTPRQGLPPFSLFLFCDPFFFVLFGCCCCCLDLVVGGILFLMMLLFLIIIVVVVVVFFWLKFDCFLFDFFGWGWSELCGLGRGTCLRGGGDIEFLRFLCSIRWGLNCAGFWGGGGGDC